MVTYNFQSYPAVLHAKFTCPSCGKSNRTRTFRSECTVNPFNRNEDGSVKSANEVRKQSSKNARLMRDQFLVKPLCKTCEDKLTYVERCDLRDERSSGLSPAPAP